MKKIITSFLLVSILCIGLPHAAEAKVKKKKKNTSYSLNTPYRYNEVDQHTDTHQHTESAEPVRKTSKGREVLGFVGSALIREGLHRTVEDPILDKYCTWVKASCGHVESHSSHNHYQSSFAAPSYNNYSSFFPTTSFKNSFPSTFGGIPTFGSGFGY